MAELYAKLIRQGLKTIENVPERFQAEVRRLLEKS